MKKCWLIYLQSPNQYSWILTDHGVTEQFTLEGASRGIFPVHQYCFWALPCPHRWQWRWRQWRGCAQRRRRPRPCSCHCWPRGTQQHQPSSPLSLWLWGKSQSPLLPSTGILGTVIASGRISEWWYVFCSMYALIEGRHFTNCPQIQHWLCVELSWREWNGINTRLEAIQEIYFSARTERKKLGLFVYCIWKGLLSMTKNILYPWHRNKFLSRCMS